MERAAAITKLKKMLGKGFRYQVDVKAPTAEQRAAAKAALPAAQAVRDALKEKRRIRYEAILTADREYQTLREELSRAQKICDQLSGTLYHYKFTVGTYNGMFFHVKSQGDSWEEVITKLNNNKS